MGAAYERVIEALAGQGFKIQHHGHDHARAQCPGHGGDDTNLAIAVGDQGVLLKCMSYDCPAGDIATAVGLTLSDLFDNQREAVYDYGGGHRVTRRRTRDGKKIIQANKPKVTSLYRHPLSAPIEESDLVVLVEGEKCVDAALRLGERCVTTWPQGADGVGQVDLAPLGGKHVRIIADNDEPGLRAAARLVARLSGLATVEGVWIVPEEKKSVDDLWLEGRTLGELVPANIQPAPEVEPPTRRAVSTFMSEVESKPMTFLWDGIIPSDCLTLIGGKGGVAKSTFAIWLAGLVTRGTLQGVLAGKPSPVLYISHEDGVAQVVKPRVIVNGADPTKFAQTGIYSKEVDGVLVPRLPEDIGFIRDEIERTGAKLIIIDPITSTMGGDNDKLADVRAVCDPLNVLAQEMGVTIIAIAHFRKGGGSASDMISGSHAWRDAARCMILFARDEEADETVMTVDKSNYGGTGHSYSYRLDSVDYLSDVGAIMSVGKVVWQGDAVRSVGEIINTTSDTSRMGASSQDVLAFVQSFAGQAVATKDIEKQFPDAKPTTIRATLSRLSKRGLLLSVSYGWWVYPQEDVAPRAGERISAISATLSTGVDNVALVTDVRARGWGATSVSYCPMCGGPEPCQRRHSTVEQERVS